MRRYTSAAVGGLGLGLLLWVVLEMADVSMPLWLLIPLGVIALVMTVFGNIPFVIGVAPGVVHTVQRVKLRVPVMVAPSHNEAQQASQPPATIPSLRPTRPSDILDALIQEGEGLSNEMRVGRFNTAQMVLRIEEWLGRIGHDSWNVAPQHAASVASEQGVPEKVELLRAELQRYDGWRMKAAALRNTVDKELKRLREIARRGEFPTSATPAIFDNLGS